MHWLKEWRDAAQERGLKTYHTYNKAMKSLSKYPLAMRSGKECKILEYFGDKICNMLDEKLAEYIEEYGTTEPVEGVIDIPAVFKAQKRKTAKKKTGPAAAAAMAARNAPGAMISLDSGSSGDELPAPVPQPRQRVASGGGRQKEYMPAVGSGPYALILTLYEDLQNPATKRFMLKKELMDKAQPLADKSFTFPDPGCRYTAWSSMGGLCRKALVTKESSPAKYRITALGQALAEKLLARDRGIDGGQPVANPNDYLALQQRLANDIPGVDPPRKRPRSNPGRPKVAAAIASIHDDGPALPSLDMDDILGVDPPRKKPRSRPKVAAVIASIHDDVPALPSLNIDMDDILGGHATHATEDLNLSNDMGHKLGTSPVTDTTEPAGFIFSYIDDAGKETQNKDRAVVLIDDEISLGFLVKCKYEDLLMSCKQYKLDHTRGGGDFVYAYLHNDDAPETAPPPTPSKVKKLPVHTTPLNDRAYIAAKRLEALEKSQTKTIPVETNTRKRLINTHNDTVADTGDRFLDVPGTSLAERLNFNQAKTKPKITASSSGTQIKKAIDAIGNVEANNNNVPNRRAKTVLPSSTNTKGVEALRRVPSWQSIGSDSQGAASTTSSVESLPPPDFTLRPGTFDVMLCVDNREHYGGPCLSKQTLVPELTRNGILFDVRPLQVGDFLWVAKPKGTDSKEQELVLDYVVERKRMDDLAGSITDGRFREQKFRMKQCGANNLIYLIEDFGSNQNMSIPEDTLMQAIANSQIIDGFYIKRTKDNKDSITYLTVMTRYLQSVYGNKTLVACKKDPLQEAGIVCNVDDSEQYFITFTEFNAASVKTKPLTVREMFGKHLILLNGLTPEKAIAILEAYPTPALLQDAYKACSTLKQKENLLMDIRFGATKRSVGPTISRQVYMLYCTDKLT